jgi:ribosomal protein S21
MASFIRSKFKEVIFLSPVKVESELLPKNKVRILYSDAKGNINSIVMEDSVYKMARNNIKELERKHKYCAILGMEVIPGNYVPFAVEITAEQAGALDGIFENAVKRGIVPDILKRYPKEIIKLGKNELKEFKKQYEQSRIKATSKETPELLQRLADYPEEGIDVAVPIYKARYHYPLIILKQLPPNDQAQPNMRKLLILDSDGDLAIIQVPVEIIDEAVRKFKKRKRESKSDGCLLYSRELDNLVMSYMEINSVQRKALNMITQYFEETGHGKRPVSMDVQTVLTKAKWLTSSEHQ